MEFVPIELFTLAGGRVADLFQKGVKKMCQDLDLEGAKPNAPRSFTIQFELKPITDSTVAPLKVTLSALKGAPTTPVVVGVHMDRESGRTVLMEAGTQEEVPMNNALIFGAKRDE